MVKARDKGQRGERELVDFLTDALGTEGLRRGQQDWGGHVEPDVVGLPGWWVECKREERPRLGAWLTKVVGDLVAARSLAKPLIAWRPNRGSWWAVLRLVDWCALVRERDHLRAENDRLRAALGIEPRRTRGPGSEPLTR